MKHIQSAHLLSFEMQLDDRTSRLADAETAREAEQRQMKRLMEQEQQNMRVEIEYHRDVAGFETLRRKEVQGRCAPFSCSQSLTPYIARQAARRVREHSSDVSYSEAAPHRHGRFCPAH
jgi:hypothetical protein